MPITTNGTAEGADVRINYETFGDPDDPALLLISGMGVQLLSWPEELCDGFVDRGFHVIRYDNRDMGFSTYFDDHDGDEPAYLLSDMAGDGLAVLDAIGVDRAHVVGMSMGGMIAQELALAEPDRVATLTSVASNTGEVGYGGPTAEALDALLAEAPVGREAIIEQDLAARRIWASRRYWDTDASRAQLSAFYDRAYHPAGSTRHGDAVLASGDRREALTTLGVPTLVIHGDEDTLVARSGGERTAELVPGATLLIIEDMGHELPVQIWSQLVEAITVHAAAHADRLAAGHR